MSGKFDYFIIFAEMRTGSNFLESNLSEFPGLQCYGEAFNPFFMVEPGVTELFGMTQAMRDGDPLRLIENMKDNTDGTPGFRFFHDHDPRIFNAAMDNLRCAKVVLTRNLVESYVSRKIAKETNQWIVTDLKGAKSAKIRFDPEEFETLTHKLKSFQVQIAHGLQRTGQTAFYIDYEDIRNLDAVNGLARYLGEEHQLQEFAGSYKKQNPQSLADKVKNFDEMDAAIAKIDQYDLGRLPNFEPRRGPMIPTYITAAEAPLMFLPVNGGPTESVTSWMAALDNASVDQLATEFTQKALRNWKRRNRGHRSFTVLSHPVQRLHNAFCRHFLSTGPQSFGEIRRVLREVYNVPIPKNPSDPKYDRRTHHSAFLGFIEFVKGNLGGQTSIRVDNAWASQASVVQGFAHFTPPDHILREEQLEAGLRYLAAEIGRDAPELVMTTPDQPFDLADIYDADIEAAIRATYQRDYMMFGFGPWEKQ